MPAVSARSILAMSGLQHLEARERLGAAGEVVERDERAALAVGVDQRLEHLAVRASARGG